MNKDDLFKYITDKNGKLKAGICGRINNGTWKDTKEHREILDFIKINFSECKNMNEVYVWIKYNLKERPKCKTCGKELQLKANKSEYPDHCCCRCTQLDPEVRRKNESTCISKFGYRNSMLSDFFKNKIAETCIRKFGTSNIFSSEKGKKKIAETNLRKYGCINPRQNIEIIEKFKKTMLDRYGVEYPSQVKDIQRKQKQKYFYNNLYFDSMIEIAYYIYLKDYNIPFKYNPDIFFDYECHNKKHRYFPDFLLIENNQLIEIKGKHFFNKDGKMYLPYRNKSWSDEIYNKICDIYEAKHQCMIKNNVKIILDSDMKEIMNYITKKYGKDYLKQFKIRKEKL